MTTYYPLRVEKKLTKERLNVCAIACRPAVPAAMFKENEDLEAAGALNEPPALEVDDDGCVVLASAQELVAMVSQLAVTPPSAAAVLAAVARQAAFEEKTAKICADATAWEAWHAAHAAAELGADGSAAGGSGRQRF